MSGLHLKHLPVNVQGREAVGSILKALAYVNNHPHDFDVIILARGGGSLEDLAAFNSEEICRAVFACKVPVVSAVGHEDDWSLTDLVCDVRASTPSNAAEIVVKDKREVTAEMTFLWENLKNKLHIQISVKQHDITNKHHLIRRSINTFTANVYRTLDKVPTIKSTIKNELLLKTNDLVNLERLLTSLDYKNVLHRGYSITHTENGSILKSAHNTKVGDHLTTKLYQGEITSIISQ
jgi:exodeoxyribonuclease VII large subunit